MEFNHDNPYTTGFIMVYNEGDSSLERFPIKYKQSINDKLHMVTTWDTLSDLAYDFYGSSKWWWLIADVNNVFDPFNLTPHKELIIPNLNDIMASL